MNPLTLRLCPCQILVLVDRRPWVKAGGTALVRDQKPPVQTEPGHHTASHIVSGLIAVVNEGKTFDPRGIRIDWAANISHGGDGASPFVTDAISLCPQWIRIYGA